jgi:hypothetical protein
MSHQDHLKGSVFDLKKAAVANPSPAIKTDPLIEKKRASLDARHRYLIEKAAEVFEEKQPVIENALLIGSKLDQLNDFFTEGGSKKVIFLWQSGKVCLPLTDQRLQTLSLSQTTRSKTHSPLVSVSSLSETTQRLSLQTPSLPTPRTALSIQTFSLHLMLSLKMSSCLLSRPRINGVSSTKITTHPLRNSWKPLTNSLMTSMLPLLI